VADFAARFAAPTLPLLLRHAADGGPACAGAWLPAELAARYGAQRAELAQHTAAVEAAAEAARAECDTAHAALMDFAYDNGKPSALAAFEATGRAYLAFARKYPGHYQAMFESGLSINTNPELALVAARASAVLEKAATALSANIAPEKRPPPAMFSAHIWAMSHGVVELFTRGPPGARSPFAPEDLLEAGIGIYLRGLGLLPPDR
jgi:hypothetical protein